MDKNSLLIFATLLQIIILSQAKDTSSKEWRDHNVEDAVALSREHKDAIVATHNARREIAKPQAANMRTMSWDDELAALATDYSRNCIYEHNPKTWHSRFRSIGENLYISIGRRMNTDLVSNAVKAWDNEKYDYTYQTEACVPGKMCGHYTQVVWDETFKVGCGVTICKKVDVDGEIWTSATLFVCNYGPAGNYPRQPYKSGKPCSACHKTDRCEKNLCTNPQRDLPYTRTADAYWQEWSQWSACASNCIARRTRLCSTFVDGDCEGMSEDATLCGNERCGKFQGEWGEWSECSRNCGGGLTKKKSICDDWRKCGGSFEISLSCNTMSCVETDATWTQWSEWGACSVTCGRGVHTKTRWCNQAGKCKGNANKRKVCNLEKCKFDHKEKEEKGDEIPDKAGGGAGHGGAGESSTHPDKDSRGNKENGVKGKSDPRNRARTFFHIKFLVYTLSSLSVAILCL